MNPDAPLARRAPAWTRALVWVLFGILASASAWALANPAEMNSVVVSVGPDGTSQVTYVHPSDLPDTAPAGTPAGDEILAAGKRTNSTIYTGQTKFDSAGPWYTKAEPNDLLPMTRWASSGLEGTPSSSLDFGTTISTMLGTLMFTLAGFGWTVLAWILSKAMTLDAVAQFGDKINDISLVLGNQLMVGSGAVAVLVFVAVLTVCGLVLKKGGRGSLRVIAALILPLAAMQVMITSATVAGKAGDADAARSSAAWGLTPAGLAERGSGAVSMVTAGMVEGIADATLNSTKHNVVKGPCSYYLNTLSNAYAAKLDDPAGVATMKASSVLWQISYLTPITEAQYGDVSEGARGICHRLEEGRVVPAGDRIAIAGVSDKNSPYSNITGDIEDLEGYNPFQRVSDDWDRTTAHLAWVACDYENGTSGRASWAMDGDEANNDKLNNFCSSWAKGEWTGDDNMDDTMEFHSGKDAEERDYNSATKPLQYKVIVYNLGQAGGGDKFMLGLSALLNAVAYLIALSMPALGAALASLGLMLFLMLLPVTLFMCAGGAGMKKMGMRLLRVTGSFIAAKALLVVLIAITVQLILLYSMLFGLLS